MSRNQGTGPPTLESTAWWLHRFAANGSGAASAGSVRLGLDVLDELTDLVPTPDGGLLMIGSIDVEHERGPAAAVRRIRPDGWLDPTFGVRCGQPTLRAQNARGGAATPGGGALVTHIRPPRSDSLVVARDPAGCVASAPLRLRGLIAGPPLLGRRRSALVSATYDQGLALIRIRR